MKLSGDAFHFDGNFVQWLNKVLDLVCHTEGCMIVNTELEGVGVELVVAAVPTCCCFHRLIGDVEEFAAISRVGLLDGRRVMILFPFLVRTYLLG